MNSFPHVLSQPVPPANGLISCQQEHGAYESGEEHEDEGRHVAAGEVCQQTRYCGKDQPAQGIHELEPRHHPRVIVLRGGLCGKGGGGHGGDSKSQTGQ